MADVGLMAGFELHFGMLANALNKVTSMQAEPMCEIQNM